MKTDPLQLLQPKRPIFGASAVLLPFTDAGDIDWDSYERHLAFTLDCGLTPAVNMDTGYVERLRESEREEVLDRAHALAGSREVIAGAFVDPGEPSFNRDAYRRAFESIVERGFTPIVFQSAGLTRLTDEALIDAYNTFAEDTPRFYAFELGEMFAPFGRIYSLKVYEALLSIRACVGAKHSSLDREQEWARLQLKQKKRPEFRCLTGNDLAIDMVMYGADYLLGLSTFAPDVFAARDRLWAAGDPGFFGLNDLLQYLGFFAFRSPVPAYKHSAAQFLRLRGRIASDEPARSAPRRPESDRAVLEEIWNRMARWEREP